MVELNVLERAVLEEALRMYASNCYQNLGLYMRNEKANSTEIRQIEDNITAYRSLIKKLLS